LKNFDLGKAEDPKTKEWLEKLRTKFLLIGVPGFGDVQMISKNHIKWKTAQRTGAKLKNSKIEFQFAQFTTNNIFTTPKKNLLRENELWLDLVCKRYSQDKDSNVQFECSRPRFYSQKTKTDFGKLEKTLKPNRNDKAFCFPATQLLASDPEKRPSTSELDSMKPPFNLLSSNFHDQTMNLRKLSARSDGQNLQAKHKTPTKQSPSQDDSFEKAHEELQYILCDDPEDDVSKKDLSNSTR
jgi:hypothetical protein